MVYANEESTVRWGFLDKYAVVTLLGPKVAYSWTCGLQHEHAIDCLWVWHDCTMELDPIRKASRHADYSGWSPTGVRAHTLHSINPLHIEASVYWPDCCGMHGWIRNGEWVDA